MNVRRAMGILKEEAEPTNWTINPVVSYVVNPKIKSKGGMYYTACIGSEGECQDATMSLSERILGEATRKVAYLKNTMERCGGWWFEDNTVWIAESEVGIMFADVTLIYKDGRPSVD